MTSPPHLADLFRGLIGAEAVETGAGVRAFKVDGQLPHCVLFPRSVEELSTCLRTASEAGLATIPVGNGTQLGIGRTPEPIRRRPFDPAPAAHPAARGS